MRLSYVIEPVARRLLESDQSIGEHGEVLNLARRVDDQILATGDTLKVDLLGVLPAILVGYQVPTYGRRCNL